VLAPGVHTTYNSGFPFSMNDGPVWTGRGLTAAARGGFAARWRVLSVRFEPQVAWTANRPVGIVDNGLTGPARFGDALQPNSIDAPQRFGDRAFATATLGQTTARVDAFGLTVGASTANQWVGPALADPLILGTNAAGFRHAFAGTSRPLNVGVGTAHVRVMAGRLGQSDYATSPADSARRLATAVTAVVTIRGVRGWSWAARDSSTARGPTTGTSRRGCAGSRRASSATAAIRATAPRRISSRACGAGGSSRAPEPRSGAEYLRNDASADVLRPRRRAGPHSGYLIGRGGVGPHRRAGCRRIPVETLNSRITHLRRLPAARAACTSTPDSGRGTPNAASCSARPAAGAGSRPRLGWDRYDPDGRWTVEAARRVVQNSLVEGAPASRWDVVSYLRAERLRFGRHLDLVVGANAMAGLNRNFGADAYQLRLDAGVRFGSR
jgi:hypothetical protein